MRTIRRSWALLFAVVLLSPFCTRSVEKPENTDQTGSYSGNDSRNRRRISSKFSSIEVALGNKKTLHIRVQRLDDNPIITPGMDRRMGTNIAGPSLIRVPAWVKNPLGRYYLYFASHKGKYLRLAHADEIEGPWKMHEPGSLALEESHFLTEPPKIPFGFSKGRFDEPRASNVPSRWEDMTRPHIASPDVHVLNEQREVRMYFHGLESFRGQVTRVAISKDGINFTAQKDIIIDKPYLRVFAFKGRYYGMAMPGIFYRSKDGLSSFERGPTLFSSKMRHAALLLRDHHLLVFWTQVGDSPERILLSTIDVSGGWQDWKESPPVELIRPELPWEGGGLPLEPSHRSSITAPANQLRDPAVFQEGKRTFLLYAVAGESGIAIAELFLSLESRE